MAAPRNGKDGGASLLDALSPQLISMVEASLGYSLSSPPSAKQDAIASTSSSSAQPSPVPTQQRSTTVDKSMLSKTSSNAGLLNPSEVFVLRQLDSPGFIVREGFLGPARATQVREACLGLKESMSMRPAQVGVGKQATVTALVADARGDHLVWLPHDDTTLPPPLQHLLTHIGRLLHGLAKAAPELRIRNVKSTQLASFPGNNTRFVPHVDTYGHKKDELTRQITCLYYLNQAWQASHGGALRVHLRDGSHWDIPPSLDTLVVFRSTDVMHEVLPTTVDRLALTTWYYGGSSRTPATPEPTEATGGPVAATFDTDEAIPSSRLHAPTSEGPSSATAIAGTALPVPVTADTTATIFVSIPSYCDSECQHTVAHLFATATASSRVFVGLCLQHDERDPAQNTAFAETYGRHARVKRMLPADATGPCLARWETQQLWRGETYYLQLDSHMRFRQGWDVYLIDQLRQCPSTRQDGASAILTTYPLGYELPNQIPSDTRPTLLCASKLDSNGLVRQCSKALKTSPSRPIPSAFWAAGFAFSHSSVLQEVPYDPSLSYLFFGEENIMAARLWTHGYDFFAPTEAVVYHLWSRRHRPTFQSQQRHDQAAQQDESVQRVLALLTGHDKTGLGRARTVEAFMAAQGVESKEIRWTSLWGHRDPIEFDLATDTSTM